MKEYNSKNEVRKWICEILFALDAAMNGAKRQTRTDCVMVMVYRRVQYAAQTAVRLMITAIGFVGHANTNGAFMVTAD